MFCLPVGVLGIVEPVIDVLFAALLACLYFLGYCFCFDPYSGAAAVRCVGLDYFGGLVSAVGAENGYSSAVFGTFVGSVDDGVEAFFDFLLVYVDDVFHSYIMSWLMTDSNVGLLFLFAA